VIYPIVASLYRNGAVYARRCLTCGACWKVYQKPCHAAGCAGTVERVERVVGAEGGDEAASENW
jgi:hypothetical protein